MSRAPLRHRALWVGLLLGAATLAVYWPLAGHDFVDYDDGKYVLENPDVRDGLTLAGLTWAFTTGHASNWHPLTWLSHMLDVEMFGLNAGRHHLVNLVLHTANTVLLFFGLRSMTGALWRSAFAASLFGLHPLHVESVAWASERKDVLSTLFWMLAMLAYVRYVRCPTVRRYGLVALSFALGLMAKPMLVTLPFVLLLLDVWPLGRLATPSAGDAAAGAAPDTGFRRSVALRLVWEKTPLLVLATASSIVTVLVQRHGGTVARFESLPLEGRAVNAVVSYAGYLGKAVWPSSLAFFYPYPSAFSTPTLEMPVLVLVGISLVVLAGISLLVQSEGRRHPYLLVGWLWYVGTLVPVIGLVQVGLQSMADRYTYIPLIGIFIMVAWGVPDLVAHWRSARPMLALGAAIVIVACMLATWRQVQHWHNSITLFEHAIAVTRDNYVAHYNLGLLLMKQRRLDEAATHLRAAVRIKPDLPDLHAALALTLLWQGNLDESIAQYREALRISPDSVEAHVGLGMAFNRLGKGDEGTAQLREALRIKPDRADTHHLLGIALAELGRPDEAVDHFRAALRIRPAFAEAHNSLGIVLRSQGKIEEAVGHFSEAVRIRPGFVEADRNLLATLARRKPVTRP